MGQQFALPDAPPEPPLPNLDQKILDQVALTNRPEITIAQAQLTSALISNYMVDAPNRPNVALTGAWGNQVSPTNNAQFYNQCVHEGFPPSQCGPGGSHFYEISIVSNWTLPLLDWGTVHAGHASAHRAIDSQIAQLSSAKQQALIDVDQAVRRLLVDRDNLGLATSNVAVARQAALISALQYRVGLATQTDVSAAQQSYLTAARDLLTAQVEYVLGIVKLKLATGTLTEAV
jgi:outer membrane protein TolC